MRLSIPQYAQVLLELEKEGTVTETASRFFAWLVRRGEGKKIEKIIKEADRMVKMQSGRIDVAITTAEESSEATRDALRSRAEDLFDGNGVDARFIVNADIIGGMKWQSDSLLYDATLSNAVRKLRTALTR